MQMRAGLVAIAAFVLTLIMVAAVIYIPVIWLAGPHSSVLPPALQSVVMLLAWAALIGVPLLVAVRAYRWTLRAAKDRR